MKTECEAVFLFISELTGSFKAGSGTKEDKIQCGKTDYVNNSLHSLDLSSEKDKADLHENVWLKRLYKELDAYFEIPEGDKLARALSLDTESYRSSSFKWQVPIELDASASLLQITGLLLNDRRLMEMTNVIGDKLQDPWYLEGISRKQLKFALTPKLYGSSQSAESLWKKNRVNYTDEEVALVNKELSKGAFGLANAFKDFVINSCSPKPTMDIKIGSSEFTIYCNKFRNVGEKTKAYKIWDSISQRYNIILHTDTKKVPDLEQFRLFFQTLLIHHLDSEIMDKVASKVMNKYGWGIPVHDAIIVSPAAANDVRKWYGEELVKIHNNRENILSSYFKSIGITASANGLWQHIKSLVKPLEGDLELNMPLK